MYYFTIVITLCFNYLICQRVTSLQHPSLENLMIPNKIDVHGFNEFFYHFRKTYIEKRRPRHVIVLGATNEDLQQAQPMLENYPSVIYTESINDSILYPDRLSPGNFVVVFLRDLTKETFNNNVDILSRCTEGKVLFVSRGLIHIGEIWLLFTLATQIHLGFPEFAHFDKNIVKLYSRYTANNCSMEVRLMLVWKPGENLNNINDWAFGLRNRNGCPVTVSTSSFEPKMLLKITKNGRTRIAGGSEGELVLTVAKTLNFTLAVKLPTLKEQSTYSQQASILRDVIHGNADIGIGRLRPTNDINESIIKFSVPYDNECITWGVPRIIKWSTNVLTIALPQEVWVLVGLIFMIGCITGYYSQKIYFPQAGSKNKIEFFDIFLDVIAIHLGMPAVNVPIPLGGKFSLLAFLCYATVLTTAYKTSLASILTTENGMPTIVDAQGLLSSNISLGGSQYDFNVLEAQANNSEDNIKLIKRFEINNHMDQTLRRLIEDQNFAYLTRASLLYDKQLQFAIHHGSLGFDVFGQCVLFYHTAMVVRRASFLRGSINLVLRHLAEAGILSHWDEKEIVGRRILKQNQRKTYFEIRARSKFKSIFILYFCSIAVSVLSFFIELIVTNLKS